MARPKTKTMKFNVALNEHEERMLNEMMIADAKTEKSGYIGYLISESYKNFVKDKSKRGAGRPPKEDQSEDENLYPHPANAELAVTFDEWEGYYKLNNLPIPELPAPIGKRN